MNRSLLAPATLLSAFSLSGCLSGDVDRVENHGFAESVQRLEISTGSGDIDVQTDPSALETHVKARVYGEATEVIARLDAGALELRHRCPKRYRQCGVDWIVTLPESEQARILDARTGSGDIDVFEMTGIFVAKTGSGDIGLHDVSATDVDLETGSGDIGARITGALESLRADTGSGDVELRIPSGAYQLDIDTGSGDVSKGGIVDDPAAAHFIDVSTGSGDVALRGT